MQSLPQSCSWLGERKGDEFSLSKVLVKIPCHGIRCRALRGEKSNSQVDGGRSNVGNFDLVYHKLRFP